LKDLGGRYKRENVEIKELKLVQGEKGTGKKDIKRYRERKPVTSLNGHR